MDHWGSGCGGRAGLTGTNQSVFCRRMNEWRASEMDGEVCISSTCPWVLSREIALSSDLYPAPSPPQLLQPGAEREERVHCHIISTTNVIISALLI